MLRVLFVGDVYGKPGRRVFKNHLPTLRDQFDFVIVNGENAAGGFGLNKESARTLLDAGADCITLGNHTWDNREVYDLLQENHILRPFNYPLGTPGHGMHTFDVKGERITVINAMGRVWLDPLDDPFTGINQLLAREGLGSVFVDFHAEATSEKTAFGFFLDGRVAGVVGTHTHIPTADTRILPKGTGYQTDAGMTGVLNSVIGAAPDGPIAKFVEKIPVRWSTAEGIAQLNGVVLHVENNQCHHIERYQYTEEQ
ncbi:TIGR00282 family metallophosphoesterase [Deinococcus cellulosilyticus]|uniref:Metallophosphoesterase n=1 Tax=Deinococcus cellulosilyticus (strain DSM 18568 / NBRC 106333 / KACC 11606 / 5516J-15) TaxID=1223518 RepID=A0A511N036_DEIC1|nr:TIGR00282 family metallophosphoesterase [Deinococcus cellulosilyticus]GEM46193.1 metallophosphoesterase [Deinococcus cellulosilyticus NBRC 106333 = KACC 11606]